MRTDLVEIDPPLLDDPACIVEVEEPVLVEALVAKLAVEAFDVGILDWLAGADEVQLHPDPVGPGVEGLPGELWAVVHHDELRETAHSCDQRELAADAQTADRGVQDEGQHFAGEVVDHSEYAEAATGR